ncbi:MAG: transcription antitermination factor NusB [Patescibacteria group bacterium]
MGTITMKAANDPRHQRRRMVVRQLFALTFAPAQVVDPRTTEVMNNAPQVDAMITKNAPEWPIDKLNKTDLAILRLAVFELIIEKTEPIKVIIDEAVELAKEMGSENSPGFINGVLGSIVKDDPRLEETKE